MQGYEPLYYKLSRVTSERGRSGSLHYPIRWHSSWRSSTTILSTMDKNNQTSMAIVCYKPGAPNPMESHSNGGSVRNKQVSGPILTIEHHESVSNIKPRFLIINVYSTRERQDPTYIKLSRNKSVYTMQ
ncbi:unnamed protein product [Rhizopus stolonifer]